MKTNSTNGRPKRFYLVKFITLLWYIFPSFSENIFRKIFFMPPKNNINENEKPLLQTAKSFSITVHNKNIQCWEWGQGSVVILVHGWGGYGLQLSKFIQPLVNRGFSVVTYDNPGHGQSDGLYSSYFEFSDTLRTIIKYFNGKNISGLIGYSFGGAAIINSLAKTKMNTRVVLISPALQIHNTLGQVFDIYKIPQKIYRNIIKQYEIEFGYSLEQEEPDLLIKDIKPEVLIIHDNNDNRIPITESKMFVEKFDKLSLFTTNGLGHKRILINEDVINTSLSYLCKDVQEASIA